MDCVACELYFNKAVTKKCLKYRGFFCFFLRFNLFERENAHGAGGNSGRERERENLKQNPRRAQSLMQGSISSP